VTVLFDKANEVISSNQLNVQFVLDGAATPNE